MPISAASLVVDVGITGISEVTRGLNQADDAVKGFGISASKILGGVVVAGAAAAVAGLGALGIAGVRAAGDLQQSVANISTIKPDIDTSAVFASLNEMQTRVPQTADALGDSLYNVFSSISVSQADALKLTEEFARSAVGAGTSAETFGTAALGVMNAYGLATEDAAHISDVFFNTVNAGVVSGEELAGSLGPVTQSAKAAGVSLDELGALVAGVTKEGGPAATNINNLNNYLQKISTASAQKQLKGLGIATTDATGAFRPTLDVLTDLKGRLGDMTEAERANALQAIFPDAQARIGAQTLLSQLDFVKQALDTNINSSGSAAAAYEKMSGTFNSQMTLAKNSMMSLATTVGGAVLPVLTGFLQDTIVPGINSMTAFAKTILSSSDPFATLVTAIDGVLPGFATLITTAQNAAQWVGDAWKSIGVAFQDGGLGEAIGQAVHLIVPKLQEIGTAVLTWIGEQAAIWGPQLLTWGQSFIGWVAPMIPPLLAELGNLALGVGSWIAEQVPVWSTQILAWGQAFISWIAPYIPIVLTELGTLAAGVGTWIVAQAPIWAAQVLAWGQAFIGWIAPYVGQALTALGDFAAQIGGWIVQQAPVFVEKVKGWGESLVGWIAPYVPVLLAKAGEMATSLWGWVTAQAPILLDKLKGWGEALVNWIGPQIPILLGKAGELGSQLIGWIGQQAAPILAKLKGWGLSLIEWLPPQIPILLGKAQDLGQRFIGWIGEQAAPILTKLKTWADSLVAWIVPATTVFLARWPVMFDQFLTWIGEQAGPLLKQLGDWAVSFIAWVIPMIPDFLKAVAGIAAALLIWVGETAGVLAKKIITEWVPAFIDWIATSVVPKLGPALGTVITAIGGWISGAARWAAGALKGIGSALIQGLIDGINSALDGLRRLLSSVSNMIPDWKGPAERDAKLLYENGQLIMQGLIGGIQSQETALQRTLAGITAGIGGDASWNIRSNVTSGYSTLAPPVAPRMMSMPTVSSAGRGGDTIENNYYTTYQVTGNYKNQSVRTIGNELRLLSMVTPSLSPTG